MHIAQGTYKPDRDEANPNGTGDREATFQLINGIALMGGYAGIGADDPDTRNVDSFQTILSGDLLGDDSGELPSTAENSYHITTGSGTDSSAVLDGFFINDGNANGQEGLPNEVGGSGGGMLNVNGSPTVIDCLFARNHALEAGGGVANLLGSNASFTECTFVFNHVDTASPPSAGGAIACIWDSNSIISKCNFIENEAGDSGAVRSHQSILTIEDCNFIGNQGENGGGAIVFYESDGAIVRGSSFFLNTGIGDGGAIWCFRTSGIDIRDTTFASNFGGYGAGIYIESDSYGVIADCTFEANTGIYGGAIGALASTNNPVVIEISRVRAIQNSGGSALWFAGEQCQVTITDTLILRNAGRGVYLHSSDLKLSNCEIWGNTAVDGSGIRNYYGNLDVSNCTIVGNAGEGCCSSAANGILSQFTAVTTVSNSIIYGNDEVEQIENENGALSIVSHSNVQGGFAGIGNIDANPLFVQVPDRGPDGQWGTKDDIIGDLHFLPGSPCIDAGDNGAVPKGTELDLDGNPRFVDDPCTTDTGKTDDLNPIVDMGAYEFQGSSCDLNGDGVVNTSDLLILFANWGLCGDCNNCPADLDGDCQVSTADLLMLFSNWG